MINKSKNKKNSNAQRGQVLLFVVVAMTIALALAVGVSLQTATTISDVSDTDTAQRSLAAAEGGAENFLTLTNFQLDDWLADVNRGTICTGLAGTLVGGDKCRFEFDPITGDNIASQADVSVRSYSGTHNEDLKFKVDLGAVKEVNVTNYNGNIQICWNDKANRVGIYYILTRASGQYMKQVVEPFGGISGGVWDSGATVVANNGGPTGFDSCIAITPSVAGNQGRKLRVYALYDQDPPPAGKVDVGIMVPPGSPLPVQGYEIISTGTLKTPSPIQIEKVVRVFRSYPYMPGIFDFVIYSEGPIITPT